MGTKKKHSVSKSLIKLIVVVPFVISLISRTFHIIGWETRQAINSIIMIVILAILAALLLVTTWISLMALILVYLQSIQWSLPASISCIIILNLLALMTTFIIIRYHKNNLSFAGLRECMTELLQSVKEIL